MSDGLFGFVFRTLLSRVNDPGNARFWLPKVLRDIDAPGGSGKLLPVIGKHFDFGALKGDEGDNVNAVTLKQWWLVRTLPHAEEFKDDEPLACPDNPWPRISMPQLTVRGLENAFVLGDPIVRQPGSGYLATIVVQFGHYDPTNFPGVSALGVDGNWAIEMCACSAAKNAPGICDGKLRDEITGVGDISLVFDELYAEATVDIGVSGQGADRKLAVRIDSLSLRGATAGSLPNVSVPRLTIETTYGKIIENIWINAAKDVLTSDAGRQALITNLNATLNHQGSLAQIADALTANLQRTFDSVLGPAPAGLLPSGKPLSNPVDSYLVDRIRLALNLPESSFYAPRVVATAHDPQLEPFKIDKVELGPQTIDGLPLAGLNLLDVNIVGFSNAVVPQDRLTVVGDIVTGYVEVGTITTPTFVSGGSGEKLHIPPPPLTLSLNFELVLPAGDGDPLTGSATATVATAEVTAIAELSGADAANLIVDFSDIALNISSANMKIDAKIDSSWTDIVNQILNLDSNKKLFVDAINSKARASLGQVSQSATTDARKIIANRLDE